MHPNAKGYAGNFCPVAILDAYLAAGLKLEQVISRFEDGVLMVSLSLSGRELHLSSKSVKARRTRRKSCRGALCTLMLRILQAIFVL